MRFTDTEETEDDLNICLDETDSEELCDVNECSTEIEHLNKKRRREDIGCIYLNEHNDETEDDLNICLNETDSEELHNVNERSTEIEHLNKKRCKEELIPIHILYELMHVFKMHLKNDIIYRVYASAIGSVSGRTQIDEICECCETMIYQAYFIRNSFGISHDLQLRNYDYHTKTFEIILLPKLYFRFHVITGRITSLDINQWVQCSWRQHCYCPICENRMLNVTHLQEWSNPKNKRLKINFQVQKDSENNEIYFWKFILLNTISYFNVNVTVNRKSLLFWLKLQSY